MKKKETKKRELEKKIMLQKQAEIENPVKKLVINLVAVLLVILIFFFITTLVTKKIDHLNIIDPGKIPAQIQYKEILAGETFNMSDEEYFVLFYDFNGPYALYYDQISSSETLKIYTVDLGKIVNKKYISDTTNSNVQNIDDLKVKDATLIKISSKQNIMYTEGRLLEIKSKLN